MEEVLCPRTEDLGLVHEGDHSSEPLITMKGLYLKLITFWDGQEDDRRHCKDTI